MSAIADTHWIGTLHLNAIRIISATLTLMVLYILGRLTGILSGPGWANVSILNVLVMPAALLIVGLSFILMCRVFEKMELPFAGLLAGLMSLAMIVFIAIGDPLIWIVRKYYPAIVPVESFNIINPHAVMMVQRP